MSKISKRDTRTRAGLLTDTGWPHLGFPHGTEIRGTAFWIGGETVATGSVMAGEFLF